MIRYLVRRLLGAVVLLLVISAITFGVFFALPTSPGNLACGKTCTPDRVAQINAALGLNRPVAVQYADYMKNIVTGNEVTAGVGQVVDCAAPCLGVSFKSFQTVRSMLTLALPVTVSIAVGASVLFLVVGVAIGVIAALRRGSSTDKTLMGGSLIFYSVPSYVLGLALQLLVVYKLQWLPAPVYTPLVQNPALWAQGLLLPWVTLATIQAAGYARFMRSSMLETLQEDYIRTARAKGLRQSVVTMRQGLRGAVTPIVTLFGLDLGYLLGGAIITEQVFSLNGIGKLSIQSINDVDLPLILGTVLLAAFFIVIANVIVDALYAVVDPRVRLS